MKSILISIKPEFVAKILNGEKTIEIRKNAPKCDLPIDVYIYCTKGDRSKRFNLFRDKCDEYHLGWEYTSEGNENVNDIVGGPYNGKVVAKFTLRKVEMISLPYTKFGTNDWVGCEAERTLQTQTMDEETLLEKSCLEEGEIGGYLNFKYSPINVGYAWHISDLVIFDKPMYLGYHFGLVKAPSNLAYVDEHTELCVAINDDGTKTATWMCHVSDDLFYVTGEMKKVVCPLCGIVGINAHRNRKSTKWTRK